MILIKDKPKKKLKAHKWFAWYPVWAWEGELLHLVWLQYVIRESWGHSNGFCYTILEKYENEYVEFTKKYKIFGKRAVKMKRIMDKLGIKK